MTPSRCAVRASGLFRARPLFTAPAAGLRRSSTAPATVVDVGFWRGLIPKPWRREKGEARAKGKSKEWNPATYFIVMFLFIGSMSIQMIVLRKQSEQHARQSTVRIALLREVIEKIRNGEEVDVEKVLGTGDAEREAGWEEVLRAIERDEKPHKPPRRDKAERSEQGETKRYEHDESAAAEAQPAKAVKTAGIGSFF